MFDEKGGRYLDCINNVAHGKYIDKYIFTCFKMIRSFTWYPLQSVLNYSWTLSSGCCKSRTRTNGFTID